MFRSSCLPKQLEAEWHFGGVKYRYGGNKEGKITQIVASCKTNLFLKDTIPNAANRSSFMRYQWLEQTHLVTDIALPYSGVEHNCWAADLVCVEWIGKLQHDGEGK